MQLVIKLRDGAEERYDVKGDAFWLGYTNAAQLCHIMMVTRAVTIESASFCADGRSLTIDTETWNRNQRCG